MQSQPSPLVVIVANWGAFSFKQNDDGTFTYKRGQDGIVTALAGVRPNAMISPW